MQPKIIVFTTPLCAPCELIKRILTTEGLAFEVRDLMVDEAAAKLMQEHGIRSAPALSINDQIYGGDDLSPERLVVLLEL